MAGSPCASPRTARTGESFDIVTVEKDGQGKEFRSDHLAFHRFVEGLMEDHGLDYS